MDYLIPSYILLKIKNTYIYYKNVCTFSQPCSFINCGFLQHSVLYFIPILSHIGTISVFALYQVATVHPSLLRHTQLQRHRHTDRCLKVLLTAALMPLRSHLLYHPHMCHPQSLRIVCGKGLYQKSKLLCFQKLLLVCTHINPISRQR